MALQKTSVPISFLKGLNQKLDFFVYRYIRLDVNTPFYVGKGKNNRAKRMSIHNKYCRRIADGCGFRIEYICKGIDEEMAYKKESEFIKIYKSFGYCQANFTDGGKGGEGHKHNKESKIKIGLAAKGNTYGRKNKGIPKPPRSQKHIDSWNAEAKSRIGKPINNKIVLCIDNGTLYESTTKAAKELGLLQSKISKVALGQRTHTGGYHFVYVGGDL